MNARRRARAHARIAVARMDGRAVLVAFLLVLAALLSATAARAEQFPKPAVLAPNVAFWKRVYVEWSVNDIALHDEADLGVVYRVVAVPPRGERTKDGLSRKEVIARATAEVEAALRSLAKKDPKSADGLQGVEKEVFLNLQGVARPDKYQRASHIRAQNGLRERFVQGYINSGLFEQTIYRELRAGGLPEELIGVAFVESLFYMGAKSKVGAAGIWQFMSYTGKEYMYLNEVIDERYDPILATEAAVKYLKQAKRELGEWPLIITSYNYGRAGMRALANAAGTKDFATILAVSKNKRFGFAARNYYASFLAVDEILKEKHIWLKGVKKKAPWSYDVVRLPFPVLVPQILATGIADRATFEHLNPGLTDAAIAGKVPLPTGMSIRAPKGRGADLVAKLGSFSSSERRKALAQTRTHKANGKQTVAQIAKIYGLSAQTLAATLGVEPATKLKKGTPVAIPPRMASYTLLPEARGLDVPVVPGAAPDVMVAAAAPSDAPAEPPALARAAASFVATTEQPSTTGTVKVSRIRVTSLDLHLPGVDALASGADAALPPVDAVAGDPGQDAPWSLAPVEPPREEVPLSERPTS